VGLYPYSSICPHGVMLNLLVTEITLPFYFNKRHKNNIIMLSNCSIANLTCIHWSDRFMAELPRYVLSINSVDWKGKYETNLTNNTSSTQFSNAVKCNANRNKHTAPLDPFSIFRFESCME
jgi:hypothetical protein